MVIPSTFDLCDPSTKFQVYTSSFATTPSDPMLGHVRRRRHSLTNGLAAVFREEYANLTIKKEDLMSFIADSW